MERDLSTFDHFRVRTTEIAQAYRQLWQFVENPTMETLKPRIVNVERLDGGVVIGFDDGKSALYSAALLYEILPHARDLTNLPYDDE